MNAENDRRFEWLAVVYLLTKRGNTVKPVFKTTWEIETTWELGTVTSVPSSIHYIENDLRNKTTSEFRTVFDSTLGVPNSQVSLYYSQHCFLSLSTRSNNTPLLELQRTRTQTRSGPLGCGLLRTTVQAWLHKNTPQKRGVCVLWNVILTHIHTLPAIASAPNDPKWHWKLHGQRYPTYVYLLPLNHKFRPVSLYDRLPSGYLS